LRNGAVYFRDGIKEVKCDRLLFYADGLVETRERAGRFFDLDHQVAAALALPDLGAAVKRVVRLLLEHSGDGLTDDVLLVLGEPLAQV
jgi:phosphoserine phosphatase RsbU/P